MYTFKLKATLNLLIRIRSFLSFFLKDGVANEANGDNFEL